MGNVLLFLTLLLTALLRATIAEGASLGLEAWLEGRYPALPHLACVAVALLVAVVAVEALALAAEHWIVRRRGP